MTERRLREIHERYTAAQERADRLRDQRNTAVREALAQRGWTHKYVGDMLGVSRSRVHQMAHRAPESDLQDTA
jgi:DNA-directed RNA polymerase specialized sigma subunit